MRSATGWAGMPARTAFSRCICCSGRKVFPIHRNLYYYAEGGDVWNTALRHGGQRPKWYCSARSRRARSGVERDGNADGPDRHRHLVGMERIGAGPPSRSVYGPENGRRTASDGLRRERLPGLRAAIEQTYAATPLTYRHYTGIPHGGCLRPAERLPQRHGDLHPRTDEIREPAGSRDRT